MADNEKPAEKPNKIEENVLHNPDGSLVTAEQRYDSDNRFNEDKQKQTPTSNLNIEPADSYTIAGTDQFGLNAVSTNIQNQRIQDLNSAGLGTAQFANDTIDSQTNPYGNDQKAAIGQFNGAESGSLSDGMVAGTIQAEIRQEQLDDLEKKRREENERAAFYALTDMQKQIAEIARRLGDLSDEIDDIKDEVNQSTILANEQINILDDKIRELKEAQKNVKDEIDDLKRNLSRPDLSDSEKEETRRMLELKQAQLDNLNHSINFSTYARDNLHKHLLEANQELESAEKHINDLKAQIQNAEGDPAKIEELKKQLALAEEQKNVALAKSEELKKQVEVTAQALDTVKAATATKTAADYACLSPEGFKNAVNKIKAQTTVLSAMENAVKNDNVIDVAETRDIMQKAKAAGITKEELGSLTINAVSAGVIVDETGARISAANAASFFDQQWASLEGELKQDLAQTNAQIDQKTSEVSQVSNAIAQNKATVAQTSALITEKTTTGSAESQASARLGAAVVGENMSLRTDVIKDTAGNAVYADRSGTTTTYYYLDQNTGQRQDYNADDPQVINFQMGKDGGEPLMSQVPASSPMMSSRPSSFLDRLGTSTQSSSVQPVKRFANDTVDDQTYQARFDQTEAQKSVLSNQEKLAGLKSELNNLKEQGHLQEADIETLNKIKEAQNSGALTEQQALQQLENLKKQIDTRSVTNVASSTTSTTSAQETLNLDTPKYTLAEADREKRAIEDKIINSASISPEEIELLKERAAQYGIPDQTIYDTIKDNKIKITEPSAYADSTPQQSPVPTQTVSFAPIGVTTQAPVIASFTPSVPTNGVTAGGMANESFADSDLFSKYNDPRNLNASYLTPINNKSETAPVASNAFGSALTVQDPAVVAQQAELRRLEQEEALRQAQQLLAAKAGMGMMGGAGTSSGA